MLQICCITYNPPVCHIVFSHFSHAILAIYRPHLSNFFVRWGLSTMVCVELRYRMVRFGDTIGESYLLQERIARM